MASQPARRRIHHRKVGMELRVIPTVEGDDYSISWRLNPKVTEFEASWNTAAEHCHLGRSHR